MEAAIEDAASREHGLVLYGLDINFATADEMVARFNGVGRKLAEKIVANRVEAGPFKDVYDIARVPGVKGKVFQRITGMVWPAQLFRHRELVSKLLGVAGNEIPDVRGVAQRFKELEGFHGCIMIDQDGLVLAKTWDHPSSEALGAFAPQMFKKIGRYVKQLKMGNIKTLTFFADENPVTLVTSGAILFVALHKPSRFSKRQVELVQALATELGRSLQR
jgi:competence ComEA-like helix-hairpin-helix protein